MKHQLFPIYISSLVLLSIDNIYSQEEEIHTDINQENIDTESSQKISSFNIAIATDWRCDENAQKTAQNIQSKDPELVIASRDKL